MRASQTSLQRPSHIGRIRQPSDSCAKPPPWGSRSSRWSQAFYHEALWRMPPTNQARAIHLAHINIRAVCGPRLSELAIISLLPSLVQPSNGNRGRAPKAPSICNHDISASWWARPLQMCSFIVRRRISKNRQLSSMTWTYPERWRITTAQSSATA